jgi:hypothetical protein
MNSSTSSVSYWRLFARSFGSLGPPLRPSGGDLEIARKTVAEVSERLQGRPLRALLLGVTPELATMGLPEPCTLVAADNCLPMIQAVWPESGPHRRVICADWRELPFASSSLDIVLGDGSANCLKYPDGLRRMASELRDPIVPGGRLVLRCYAQMESPETPDEVFADQDNPALPSFHHFKFRLLMAMQTDAHRGIRVRDVYREWRARLNGGCRRSGPGWQPADLATIEFYKDADTVHTFPTLAQFQAVLAEYFDEIAVHRPRYVLGERCPTMVLSPRPATRR